MSEAQQRGQHGWRKNKRRWGVGGKVTEGSGGDRSCKSCQAMVRTLAFTLSEMGARG